MAIFNPDDLVTEDYLLQEGWTCEKNCDDLYIYRIKGIYQFVLCRYCHRNNEFYIEGTDIQIKYIRHLLDVITICKEEDL